MATTPATTANIDILVPATADTPVNKVMNIIEDGRPKALNSSTSTINFDMLKATYATKTLARPQTEDDVMNFGSTNSALVEMGTRAKTNTDSAIAGQFVQASGAGAVVLANGNTIEGCGTRIGYVMGGVLLSNGTYTDPASGGNVLVKFSRGGKLLSGFSGLTPGALVYLDYSSSFGAYTQDISTIDVANCLVQLGTAVSATEMEFDPQPAVEII